MKVSVRSLAVTTLLGLSVMPVAVAQESADDITSWDFDVYLDNKKLGKHSFEVSKVDGSKRVLSEASFRYKFLFIPAYRYDHMAAERWTDNCLVEFDAQTNTNGKKVQVSGIQSGDRFIVDRVESQAVLPECVMTFAYWNPDFLDQSRLLNPQTGEYVDVNVVHVGGELLNVRGEQVAARKFQLTADQVDLTLWYSADDEWLALESVAKGGRVIRYELS